jgi:hypothetical protein
MGPEGLEPSPAWLRARCAAANTLIPVVLSCALPGLFSENGPPPPVDPGGLEPPPFGYQPSALPLELQVVGYITRPRTRAGGIRTPSPRFKRPVCRRYTTTPHQFRGVRLIRVMTTSFARSGFVAVQSGRPESNRRSPAPKAGGMPTFLRPVSSSAEWESDQSQGGRI